MTARSTSPLTAHVYVVIGESYGATRRADPRIENEIWAALGDSRSVLNLSAETQRLVLGRNAPPRTLSRSGPLSDPRQDIGSNALGG
jgi:hypothetical protein